jgi:hypothetical protein
LAHKYNEKLKRFFVAFRVGFGENYSSSTIIGDFSAHSMREFGHYLSAVPAKGDDSEMVVN